MAVCRSNTSYDCIENDEGALMTIKTSDEKGDLLVFKSAVRANARFWRILSHGQVCHNRKIALNSSYNTATLPGQTPPLFFNHNNGPYNVTVHSTNFQPCFYYF